MSGCVYIGLGSNLENPQTQLNQAITALEENRHIKNMAISPFYRSKPVGPVEQPDFINAVARFTTTLTPHQLLDLLQSLEAQQGRERKIHWGPRTLDLDILLFGDHTIASARLTVPHAQMQQRAFVLVPLHDLAPTLIFPNGESLTKVIAQRPIHEIKSLTRIDTR